MPNRQEVFKTSFFGLKRETEMLLEITLYLLSGAFVGLMAGLLGIGGGLILVPILTSIFTYFLGSNDLIHLAIGTSLATILITSFSAVRAHHQLNNVQWNIVKTLTIGIFAGAFLGGWGAQFIPTTHLTKIFATFEALFALYFILDLKPHAHKALPALPQRTLAGAIIGAISSLVGIGGGTITTPYLVWHNVPIRQAIATSAACSLPIAAAGTFGFLIGGMNATNLPAYSTGYIYWPAFLGIIATSYLTAPIGAKLAHRLPVHLLKKIFAVLLLLLSIKMFFF